MQIQASIVQSATEPKGIIGSGEAAIRGAFMAGKGMGVAKATAGGMGTSTRGARMAAVHAAAWLRCYSRRGDPGE